jgi:hypothetical protein
MAAMTSSFAGAAVKVAAVKISKVQRTPRRSAACVHAHARCRCARMSVSVGAHGQRSAA